MTLLTNPIPLGLEELLPDSALFSHPSRIHGRDHVARVMIHAFLLLRMHGFDGEAAPLWAAVFMHDLARTHDGLCTIHGADAVRKAAAMPELRAHFSRGGLCEDQYSLVHTAVTHHSLFEELDTAHPHYRLTALLKDADALDRVRIHDLNTDYLRFPKSHTLACFADKLFKNTPKNNCDAPDFFSRLWDIAVPCLEDLK